MEIFQKTSIPRAVIAAAVAVTKIWAPLGGVFPLVSVFVILMTKEPA